MANTHQFQTEVRQLLDIVIHAFYSDREVFVRELVSNASDALEKLRLKQLTQTAVYEPERELRITVTTDEEAGTLTITDSGIGMTQDEVVEYLGTIAHSGTKKFLEAMKESKGGTQDLIGQFGVGFYSVFMAADKVEVTTRSWQPDAAPVKWESDGQEGYTLTDAAADTPRGTSIKIFLKEDAKNFAKGDHTRYILSKYSNFVGFPIDFNGEHLNTVQAIWMKNKKDVKPEEYEEFYKFTAHSETAPMSYMHFSADAPIVLNSVLFVPEENPEAMGFGRCEPMVSLYCHKVLIDSKPEKLLPEWLRFLAGVVDSEDLPLNISREMLQQDRQLKTIANALEKKIKIENNIEKEIDNNRFFLEYQPVLDAKTKKIIGAEVLSRLNSESEGILAPKSFLSAVDSVGINEKFDYYIFEKNCKWISNDEENRNKYVYTINFSRFTLCDQNLAEDITQETFFKALKNIEKYDPQQNILTWLCTIAKNTWYSQCIRSRNFADIPDDLASTDEDIIDTIIDSEDSMEILRVLHSLPEPYKEVFTLRVLGSFSYSKIGEVFHKGESWARVIYHRAGKKLAERMKDFL